MEAYILWYAKSQRLTTEGSWALEECGGTVSYIIIYSIQCVLHIVNFGIV